MIRRDNWWRRRCLTGLALFSFSILNGQAEEKNYVARMQELGLDRLKGSIPAYYSVGHQQHAEKLQAAIADMNVFFRDRLGVQAEVTLALLNSKDWKSVTGEDYGIPQVEGNPPVIFMPATPDNPVFGLMNARKEAIPSEQLQAFLKDNHTTFEAVAAQFVDLIGFHELGHALTNNLGIDPQDSWLSEFLANYWSYAYIAERQPEWKRVFALLGRPSKIRPKNTTLEDFELLYSDVDDYGWYQGMFESRIREIYPLRGLQFLRDLKREFPRTAGRSSRESGATIPPAQVLERLEKIAPGFQKWATEFNSSAAATSPRH